MHVMCATNRLFMALSFDFIVHCSGFIEASGCICDVHISIIRRPCRDGFCFPPVVAAISILNLSLSLSLKQTNLRVCLSIAIIAPAAVLTETNVVFATSGF